MKTTRLRAPQRAAGRNGAARLAVARRRRLHRLARVELAAFLGHLLGALDEFAQHAIALELRDMVDKENAVEMVDLVLKGDGEDAVGLDLLGQAVAVEEADANPV